MVRTCRRLIKLLMEQNENMLRKKLFIGIFDDVMVKIKPVAAAVVVVVNRKALLCGINLKSYSHVWIHATGLPINS